jgi:hypothetical protein
VFDQIAKKSVREAEKITLSLSSAPTELKPDLMKAISADKVEFKFTAAASAKEKIEKLKGFLAHTSPNISLGELLEKLCDLGLKEWDPAKAPAALRKRCVKKRTSTAKKMTPTNVGIDEDEDKNNVADSVSSIASNVGISTADVSNNDDSKTITSKTKSKPHTSPVKRPSAAQTRRNIFARARSACENCGSTFALEIDHIHPKALGGSSDAENLRVLCKSCNQRAAIQVFGLIRWVSISSRHFESTITSVRNVEFYQGFVPFGSVPEQFSLFSLGSTASQYALRAKRGEDFARRFTFFR